MKRKDFSLSTTFIPYGNANARSGSLVTDSDFGDISRENGHIGFSRSWKTTIFVAEPEDWSGQKLSGRMSVGADDIATLSLEDYVLSVPDVVGPQGGSRYTSKSCDIELMPGVYSVSLEYKNISYNPPAANIARLDFEISLGTVGELVPNPNPPIPLTGSCGCSGEDTGGVPSLAVRSREVMLSSSEELETVAGTLLSSSAGRNTRLEATETYLRWRTDFGKFRGLGGISSGELEIFEYGTEGLPCTAASLEFSHPFNSWISAPSGGVSANVQFSVWVGGVCTVWYCDGNGERFFKLGASKKDTTELAWNEDKTALVLTHPDKSEITFSAATGELVSYKTRSGNVLSKAEIDLYSDIVRDGNGVLCQVWNLWDGLMSVENASESGYEIALYLPGQVGEKDAESGLYAVTGTAFKRFTVSVTGTELQKLTVTELDSRAGATAFARSVWFENGVWNSSVGSGSEEIVTRKTRTAIDETHFRVVTETLRSGESVPASSTSETFEIHPVLGNLCVSRTQAYGTDYAETTNFSYDTNGRLIRETRPDGGVFETTFDRYGRVCVRYEPDAFGRKITYFYYQSETGNDADLKYSRVALEKPDGTPVLLSRTDYVYAEEAEYRRVERRTTALGSDNTQLEIEETFLGTCTNVYARGRVKMRRAKSGVQTHYAYAASSLYGACYTQTAETRINGEPVSGKSSREVKFISSDGNTLRSEKYLLDIAGTWQLVSCADFEYDAQNRETKRTRGNGRVSSRESMCCGTLWEVDEDGVRTDYVYDTAQQLTEKTRALTATQPERTQLFTRDAAGRVTREVLKLNSVNFSEKSAVYDALGRVVSEADELGRTTTYAYALNAAAKTRTETVTLPTGATRITTTHASGAVLSEAGTSRRNTETAVDSVSDGIRTTRRLAGTTDDSGILSREIKNGFGETIRTASPDTLGEFIYTRNSFDAFGRLTRSATDTLAPMLYEYDAFGNETKRTLVLADEPTALNSRITETSTQTETRADGVYRLVSTTTHSASGTALVTSVATLVSESALFESKTISTDVRGNASTRWTEFGTPGVRISKTQIPTATNIAQTTTNDGFTVSQIDHAGTQTGFARQYNTGTNAGIVLTTTDGRGNAKLVEQNVLGWTTKTTDAAGNITTTVYDLAHGKPSCVTDALGKTHCYAYDLHGNVVAEFGSGAQPAVFSFDDADNLISQKLFRVPGETLESDPRSREDLTADETTWSYHAATGLLLTKTYPDEGQIDYSYDAQNRLASTTWTRDVSEGVRLKATRTYTEKTGELVSVSYNDGTTPTETHSYNHLGQLTQTVDASGTRVYVYDNYNEIESETLTGDGVAHAVTELRDALGRGAGYTYTEAGSTLQTTGVSYAAATGRIATASFVYAGSTKTFSYNYLAGTNLLESLACPSNLTIVHAYEDKRDLVTGITIRRGAGTNVVLRNYTYDALERPLTRSTSRNGSTQNDTFGYNPRSELVSATLGNANYAYAFDNIGNRETASVAGTQSSYSTNNLNQYISIETESSSSSQEEGDRATSAVESLTYDADGNATQIQTSTGTWAITYNGANRPVRFRNEETDTTVECGYDSQGRRYFKKVTVAGTVMLYHRYLYRGYLQIACVDCTRSGHPALWLVTWDPSQPTATRPLAIQKDGNWFTYGYDITKNVCEVFGPAGYIRTAYSYAPFGAVTESGDVTQPFQWSSEHYDSELDLVYYNFRHYSPTLGRFLSRDPIAEQGGLNLYTFVKNNPILIIDMRGQECHTVHREIGGKCKGRTLRHNPNYRPNINGCGSKGSEWVPDSFFGLVDFTPACNTHDVCYGTCGANKAQCDINLGVDMAAACLNALAAFVFLPGWGKAPLVLCLAQAATYSAVLLAIPNADDAFEDAQNDACIWEDCCKNN